MLQLACFLLLPALFHSSAFALQLPRGVPIAKSSFYQPGSTFLCLDGSATIPWSRVNDDYCDCRDGSDEPGTSACPNGHFHCRDMKYMIVSLPSGYVNDNFCDCCDGSDEYENRISCPSTCSELAAAVREAQSIKRSQIEKGHKLFLEYVAQLKERKEQQRIAEEKAAMEKQLAEESEPASTTPHSEDQSHSAHEDQPSSSQHLDGQPNPESEHLDQHSDNISEGPVEFKANQQNAEHDETHSESEDQYDDSSEDDSDDSTTYAEPAPAPIPIDFGPEDGFRMLTELPDECLEFHNQEYTYSLCPFKNVSQRGRDTPKTTQGTLLGHWSKWMHSDDLETERKYEVMYYSNGLGCWNGPDRSVKVFVHCGEKNEITAVNEPSRCEYTFDLTTPAACYENPDVLLARLHPESA